MRRFVLSPPVLIAALCFVSASAQQRYIPSSHLKVADGLSQNFITAILQDRLGFLWLGTKDGLNRFDGYQFEVFRNDLDDSTSLSNNYVTALCEDADGALWVGTLDAGLNRYDRATESFHRFQSDPSDSLSLPGNRLKALHRSGDGRLYVGTEPGGVSWFDRTKGSFHRVDLGVRDVGIVQRFCDDVFGGIWVQTQKALVRLDKASKPTLHQALADGGDGPAHHMFVTGLTRDSRGTLWLSSRTGIDTFDVQMSRWMHVTFPGALGHSPFVRSILAIDEWMCIVTEGVMTFIDPTSGIVSSMRAGRGANRAFRDRSGVLWCGSTGDGIYSFVPSARAFEPQSGVFDERSFRDELRRAASDLGIPYASLTALPHVFLRDRRRNVWLSTANDGIIMIPSDGRVSRRIRATGTQMNRRFLCEDRSGTIWAADHNRILRFESRLGRFAPVDLVVRDSAHKSGNTSGTKFWTNCLLQDRSGTYWIGTGGDGLLRWEEEGTPATRHTFRANDSTSISNNSILCIAEDPDYPDRFLWIGTEGGGMNRLDLVNRVFTRFRLKDGLPNEVVYAIAPGNDGNLWLSTNKGLSRFTSSNGRFRNYEVDDGLQGNEFNRGEFLVYDDGRIAFGGTNGYNEFLPSEKADNPYAPIPHITGLRLVNRKVDFRKRDSPIHSSLIVTPVVELDYSQNMVTFEYVGLEFTAPRKNTYRYMLEGFDPSWIEAGRDRAATYTNLDPGRYLFRVRAANASGTWSTEEAILPIVIRPPFWMTWWFRGLLAVAFLSIGPIVYYRRVSFLKRQRSAQEEVSRRLIESQEQERSRIAKEIHDGFGQELLVIRNRAMLAMKTATHDVKATEQFEKIAASSATAIDTARLLAHNLRPPELDRLGLTETIRSSLEAIRESTGLTVRDDIDTIDGLIPKDLEIALIRIIQEGLANILKHADARRVTVIVKERENDIRLRIQDDGKGFDVNGTRRRGMGMTNILERVRILGGIEEITSAPGKGTTIVVDIPVRLGGTT